ncbi:MULTISPECIES: restriction endonuclease subunit S [unclassified Bradyrhizobium]|uniref:restriction endonuclease subunit S n=1 Tax=unclassified Bradyrhizobium TaxID=2631580 RepID=UPI002915C893|nr:MULTISPECIES: restriction endonuclease subunit S [unclassified Bradyrhizobium]
MKAWATFSLGELGRIVTGRTPPSSQEHYFSGHIPFLTPTDIDGEHRDISTGRTVSAEWDRAQSRISLPPRAVCVVCIGATIGKVCMASTHSQSNQQINSIIVDESRFDPHFIYYRLRVMRNELKKRAAGAATPILNKSAFSGIEIELPKLDVQRRVSSILGAYDDLIKVNRRRIALLEEMAQRVFVEWFVRFNVPMITSGSQLASLPDGWREATLKSLTSKIGSGATPTGGKRIYDSEGISLIRSLNVYDYQFEYDDLAFIDASRAAKLDHVAVEANDVLLNITGASVGRCCMVPTNVLPARVNQHVAIIRADIRQIHPAYLLDAINNATNKMKLLNLANGGATREALTKETIERFKIVVPTMDVLRMHEKVVAPIHHLRDVLTQQNHSLRGQRDLLLPKLVVGDVTVSTAERELEAVA